MPPARKQTKLTIIPSQSKNDKNTVNKVVGKPVEITNSIKQNSPINDSPPSSSEKITKSKIGENGRNNSSTSKPQLEKQVRIDRSRSRSDNKVPLSKSESTTGKIFLSS